MGCRPGSRSHFRHSLGSFLASSRNVAKGEMDIVCRVSWVKSKGYAGSGPVPVLKGRLSQSPRDAREPRHPGQTTLGYTLFLYAMIYVGLEDKTQLSPRLTEPTKHTHGIWPPSVSIPSLTHSDPIRASTSYSLKSVSTASARRPKFTSCNADCRDVLSISLSRSLRMNAMRNAGYVFVIGTSPRATASKRPCTRLTRDVVRLLTLAIVAE